MVKNNNNFLLARIDERTEHIQDDIKDVKHKQGKIFDKLGEHNTRIAVMEEEHKKPWKFGSLGLILKLLGFGR